MGERRLNTDRGRRGVGDFRSSLRTTNGSLAIAGTIRLILSFFFFKTI